MESLKNKLKKNKIVWIIPLYAAFYLPWFIWLEKNVTSHYYVIHLPIDDKIPFCEFFIIFYYLWFVYMIGAVTYCVFTDQDAFFRGFIFIASGMTLFLVISTLFPNGHDLRPSSFPRDNIFTSLLAFIYKADTPTNIFPSLHVYNAVGAHLSLAHNKAIKDRKGLRALSLFTCIGITLSTLFLKQHSTLDVIGALVLSLIMYPICFCTELKLPFSKKTESLSNN